MITLVTENLYRPLVPPPMKVLCYSAIADLFQYLPESKANPQALHVRQKLQIAAWMSLWPLKLEKYVYVHDIVLQEVSEADIGLITVRSVCRIHWGTSLALRMASHMELHRWASIQLIRFRTGLTAGTCLVFNTRPSSCLESRDCVSRG